METILTVVIIQAFIGAYDTIYHHDLREGLPYRKSAALELKIHSMRSSLYSVMFFALAWTQPHGIFAVLFAALIVVEIGLTFWDFVVEDQTRVLPPSERILHSILGFNFAMIVTLLIPHWWQWLHLPTVLAATDYGIKSWLLSLFGVGVLPFSWREWRSYRRLSRAPSKVSQLNVSRLPAQKILVTGATGFLGKTLCRVLIAQGHRITVLARDFSRAMDIGISRITLVSCIDDLSHDDHFDTVINLAGEPIASQRWTEARKKAITDSRIELTRQLVNWIANAKQKPSLLISGSAVGYYGPHDQDVLDENGSTNSSFSHQLCRAWEAAARDAHKFGVRVVLLRTGLVLGQSGGLLSNLLSLFSLGLGGRIGQGRQWMSWIHLHDWIGIVMHVMQSTDISGPVNATAPAPVTNREFTKTLGRALHRPTWMTLPAFAVKTMLGEMGKELLLQGQQVLPVKIHNKGYQFQYPALSPAIEEIVRHA